MTIFRKIIFWSHLTTGTIAGLIVLIMSVTGVLLAYERQITAWADTRSMRIVPGPDSQTLAIEALLVKTRESLPDAPSSIAIRSDPAAPVTLAFSGGRVAYVHPYTGEILGTGAPNVRAFFRFVTDWHRWLGASGESRAVGRAITGACNLGFLFIVVSGLYLWWPRKRTRAQFRNIMWFRRTGSTKARDFNWHNVIGFWMVTPLFIVVLSGVVISYAWAGNLVYRIAGETPPAPRGGGPPPGGPGTERETPPPDGLDRLLERARRQVPGWRTISFQIPPSTDAPAVFSIDEGDGGQPQKRGQLTLDRATGDVVRWEPFSSYTRARQARSFLRFAHTGEVAGIAGQTIAGVASLGATVLVWTGLALAWRRFRAWTARRSGREPVPGSDEGS